MKESDRIAGVVDGLRGLGADIEATDGRLRGARRRRPARRHDRRPRRPPPGDDGRGRGPRLARGRRGGRDGRRGGLLPVVRRRTWQAAVLVSRSTAPPGPASRPWRARSRASSASPTSTAAPCTAAWRCSRWRSRRPTPRGWPARCASSSTRARRRTSRGCCSTGEDVTRGDPHARGRGRGLPGGGRRRPCARRCSAKQRALLGSGDWVAEGRDIGTVVAPDAELKVFLTADPRERARRRALEQRRATPRRCWRSRTMRDERDRSREHARCGRPPTPSRSTPARSPSPRWWRASRSLARTAAGR